MGWPFFYDTKVYVDSLGGCTLRHILSRIMTKGDRFHAILVPDQISPKTKIFVRGHTIGMKWEGLQWEMVPPLHSSEENQWKSKARV